MTVVTTISGKIRGKISANIFNEEFLCFLGIPYAKPPIGNLRFKAPQPPEPWSGIRDGSLISNACFSRHTVLRELIGDEDCLFLNVFTRSTQKKSPVMFWIHGGGFTSGSADPHSYGPDYLMTQDIVLVTINYRVGVLGFLSFEDPTLGVPGNAGLKDMVMALNWVKENIENFGGDPGNVTIFGESAGAASVHYLMLSPMAKGLFHKAIAQSGCALNPWARGRRCVLDLAKKLDMNTTNELQILEKLRNLPVKQIFQAAEKLPDHFLVSHIRPFAPVIERLSAEPAFLSENPVDIIRSGNYNKVPFLIGYNTREGMLCKSFKKNYKSKLLNDFEYAIPNFLNLRKGSDISKNVAKKIKEFYYGNDEKCFDDIDRYYLIETDNFFVRDIYNTVKYHSETSTTPIYFYRMSIETNLNIFKKIFEISSPGVCHADDIGYLFKTVLSPDLEPGSLEEISVKRFVKLWSNFARYGDPNPKEHDPLINAKWKPVKRNQINFIDIGKELRADVNPDKKRMDFWDEIFKVNPVFCKL